MSKKNISRRDFLKMTLQGLGSAFLAACEQLLNPAPTATPAATPTNTPTSTNTPIPSETPTPTATSTPTEIPCFKLIAPENGGTLPAIGKVTFSWESMLGTKLYRIEFTLPNGTVVFFETPNINLNRYIESFPLSGTYSWQVTALDANGETLCISNSFSFIKPESESNSRDGRGGGGGDGAGGGDNPGPTVGPVIGPE